MLNHKYIPHEFQALLNHLGYWPVGYVPLVPGLVSLIGIKDEKRFNLQVQAKMDGKNIVWEVASIHYLKPRWNQSGSKILDIQRIKV